MKKNIIRIVLILMLLIPLAVEAQIPRWKWNNQISQNIILIDSLELRAGKKWFVSCYGTIEYYEEQKQTKNISFTFLSSPLIEILLEPKIVYSDNKTCCVIRVGVGTYSNSAKQIADVIESVIKQDYVFITQINKNSNEIDLIYKLGVE